MPGRRRGTIAPPATTDATASLPPSGKHPFDAMLEDDGDSYGEIEHGLVESVEQDEHGNDVKFNFRVPPRRPTADEAVPEGYVRTRGGNLAETVSGRGPTQSQYNWIVDLLEEKDLTSVNLFARQPDLTYEDGKLELRQRAFMGTRAVASTAIDMLKSLPRKANANGLMGRSSDDQRRLRVKYHEVPIDGGRSRRIGYLTDQPENMSFSWSELKDSPFLRVPESKFALDTSEDARFANDVTFFHLWVGDRFGWKLYMFKSDDEIEIPVGKAVPLIRRFAANMEECLKLYGDEHSRCGICNRKLTKDESRARGIGPVCAENWL
jgi:hypothetical protein